MEILRLKSEHPISPYAPIWNAPIGFAQWEETDKVDTIREFLLVKEKQILIDLPYRNDGRTGLDSNNVTTRHGRFNTFEFKDECPEIGDLLKWLKFCYFNYIMQDGTRPYNLRIGSWFNVIRKGDCITKHRHSAMFSAYLSGNMHLDDYETCTYYEHMEQGQEVSNFKGGMTLFPSYVEHAVPEYTGTTPRVSIAFDLYLDLPPYYSVGENIISEEFFNIENDLQSNESG